MKKTYNKKEGKQFSKKDNKKTEQKQFHKKENKRPQEKEQILMIKLKEEILY